MRQVLTVLSAIVLFVYPFAVYFGIDQLGLNLVGILLVAALLLRMFAANRTPLKEFKLLAFTTSAVGILLAILGVVFEQHGWLKFYPVLVNLCMLGLFSLSLTQPQSIVERLARLNEPDLPQSGVIYTRKVTAVWCGFFILNASIALYTCFQPIEIWVFYNGFISYLVAGSLFAGGMDNASTSTKGILNRMNTGSLNISSIATLMTANREAQSTIAYDKNKTMSWGSFQNNVARLQATLENLEAQRIALYFGNSYLFAISFFACCYSGKSIVLPGNYQPEALRELDKHFDLILHGTEVAPPSGLSSLCVNTCSNSRMFEWQTLSLADISLTLFTSGSSGNPKAVRKTLKQLDVEIATLNRLWGDKLQGANIESTVSHQHIYGLLFRVLWPLCSETPFATHNLEFPEQVCHLASPETVLISSPALLRRLSKELQTSALRCIFSSGGPLPNNSAYYSQLLFGSCPIEVFGSTETGGIAYRQQSSANQLWTLFPDIEATLNNKNCLKLRSAHIDKNRWYQTTDECYFHENGYFELCGRTDRVVKIEEKRVSLVEAEKRLEQLSWVEESAVIPVREAGLLSLFAVIVLTTEGNKTLKELGKGKFWIALRKALLIWLEPVAIPRKYRILDEIPLNSQGKRHPSEIKKTVPRINGLIMDKRKPTLKQVNIDQNVATIDMYVDAYILDFQGHFTDFPLLPGVTQIDWALFYAVEYIKTPTIFKGMEVIKFNEPILPNMNVNLSLSWDVERKKLAFKYTSSSGEQTKIHSSGKMKLGN